MSIKTTVYQPTGVQRGYIPPLAGNNIYSPDDSDMEILASHGFDATYPGQFCDALMFAGYVTEINQRLNYNPAPSLGGALDYINPFQPPEALNSKYLDLQKPLNRAYNNNETTHFIGGEEFGQDETSTVPSKVMIKPVVGGTAIEWYYNGSVVNTDTIASHNINEFALAIQFSGATTISAYAIIWYENGIPWSSGSKNNSDVIQKILSRKGAMASNQTPLGWVDPNDPDNPDRNFILSTIDDYYRDEVGVYGWVIGYDDLTDSSTYYDSNNIMAEKTNKYGDIIGTDLLCWLAETNNLAEAWAKFNDDPEFDRIEFEIPYTDPDYTYKMIWHQDTKQWYYQVNEDPEIAISYQLPSSVRQIPCHLFITVWDDSQGGGTCLGLLQPRRLANQRPGYWITRLNNKLISDVDYEEFDYEQAYFEDSNGYDTTNPGEEDNPQPDADDMDDPSIDALSTGFVYAFDVNTSDMENLVSCLNGNTLAQKIKDSFGNHLFDFIVSYHTMPCITNATEGDRIGINYMGVPFIYGENDTQLTLKKISKSWYSVDLGSKLCLPTGVRPKGFENWSSAQVQMYLPFIGTVHLNTPDVWGKNVYVCYYFDVLTGTCTANIGIDGKGTIYSYEGSCAYKIPFTTVIDTSVQQMISGIMTASSGYLGAAASAQMGNIPGAINGIIQGSLGSIGNFISAAEHKAIVNRGGSLGGAGGWHTPRSPALIITVPDYIKVDDRIYRQINGYPTHKAVSLSDYVNQYVEVAQIDLKASINSDGATPNDSEMDMIRSILNGGVFV